jgi:SagB-type dehydrogenase family enzyme
MPSPKFSPEIFLVALNVTDIPAGVYRYDISSHTLKYIRPADRSYIRSRIFFQPEHADGAAVVFIAGAMATWLNTFGDKGYRAALFQAGWLSDRLYLIAEHLRLQYTSSGSFSPWSVDRFLEIDGYQYTTLFSFVIG